MAKEYEIKVPAHKSIYSENPKEREINVYFCEPENGVNEDTGMVLFIPGFGGDANSNVYKKMRKEFADKYNLVTVQCDYFGQEFMQGPKNICSMDIDLAEIKNILTAEDLNRVIINGKIDIDLFIKIAENYNSEFIFNAKEDLSEENYDNFNDMGLMQALDNVYSILYVFNILLENNLAFNSKKVIIYGHSHGSYLAHLCNIIAPTLFKLIIDNSGWLLPVYIKTSRYYKQYISKNVLCRIEFKYNCNTINMDKDFYFLGEHYKKIKNNCNIISFHGSKDCLIYPYLKKRFCNLLDKYTYYEVTDDMVDGIVFKSCLHGLDADFLKLFEYALGMYINIFEKGTQIDLLDTVELNTQNFTYKINYSNILPVVTTVKK